MFAEREGVPVTPVVAAGMAAGRDAILVVDTQNGRPLATVDPTTVDEALLARIWGLDVRLFQLGIAHGALDGNRVVVRPDGTPAIGDFGQATVAASDAALRSDRAQLLVSTALMVDHRRAVWAAAAVIGSDAMAEMLPYLQPAAPRPRARGEPCALKVGSRRPEEARGRSLRRRAPRARADPAGDLVVRRDGRGDRPRRIRGDLCCGRRRARQPDPGVRGRGPCVAWPWA